MATKLQAPEQAKTFEHSSVFDTTVEKMRDFHAQPNAFGKLTPPPVFVRVQERNLASLTDGDIKFTLWMGPFPVRWHARHEPSANEHSFADRQLDGPMAFWLHNHIIEPVEDGVRLTDRITLAHKPGAAGLLTRLLFDGLPLRLLFVYRHLRTRFAVTN